MSLLAGVATQAYSWFKAGGAGKWYSEVGSLLNDSCDGGILEALEKERGREFPYLRAQRQECVDRWRDYQRALPWNKSSTLEVYNNTVNAFVEAIQAEEKAGFGGLAGITDIVKKPFVLILVVALIVLVVVFLIIKR